MPDSTITNDSLTMTKHCPYTTGLFPEETHSCPADMAIRCANDILEEIAGLHTVKDQEQQFSGIIARNLNRLFVNKRENDNKIICFWALSEKSTEEELKKGLNYTKKQAQITNLNVNKANPINNAISTINDEFRSLKFLECLVENSIGKNHVFDIQPDANEVIFRAYTKERQGITDESQIVFEYRLTNGKKTTIKTMLGKIQKTVVGTDISKAEFTVIELIRKFCLSFEYSVGGLLTKIEKQAPEGRIKLDKKDVASACAHFALIALFAEYNGYLHASYILAISFRGKSHSSMILFWPFILNNSLTTHIIFLLHLVLGLNAIDTQAEQRIRWIDLVHAHDQKNILQNSVANPLRLLREKMAQDEEKKSQDEPNINEYKNIKEYIRALQRTEDSISNYIENLSFILDGFKALEKGGYVRIDKEVLDTWNRSASSCDPLQLGQICSPNQIIFSLVGEQHFPVDVLSPQSFLNVLFHILIQNSIDAINDQGQQIHIRVDIQLQQNSVNSQWCVFSIWNENTLFPGKVLQNGGTHPLECRPSHSGLGLFIVEHLLEYSGAKKKGGKHLHLVNTVAPSGAKVEFSLPVREIGK